MAAGTSWRRHNHRIGVYYWLHRKFMAGVGGLELQSDAREYPGTDLPSVFCTVDTDICGRDYTG